MGEPRDETWYLETKKRIREAFQLFDKDRKGCVVQEEVATIMRYLGAYPTERAVPPLCFCFRTMIQQCLRSLRLQQLGALLLC